MGEHSSKSKKRKKYLDDTFTSSGSSSSSSPSSSESAESSRKRHKSSRRRHRDDRRRSSDGSSRREREKRRKERKKRDKRDRKYEKDGSRKSRRDGKKRVSHSTSEDEDDDDSGSPAGDYSDRSRSRDNPEDVIKYILKEFPGVTSDLEQLLKMIDDGQAVDIRGLSERSLVRYLRKLFLSLNLKENGDLVFLLPSNVRPTLDVVGPIIRDIVEPIRQQQDHFVSEEDDKTLVPPDTQVNEETNNTSVPCGPSPKPDSDAPRRRVIGPEMPSAELLAAAAKLTEAEAELREAEMHEDAGEFIGPPPPAMVKEAASANEAERFEEVTRIMAAEGDSPYDVVGVNRNMAADNIKKRYWKLSLMVHPDKCSHPQAQEAFVKLNKAFKDLQDPDKRKAMDDKIKLKEEQESLKAELKEMREAAQWRRLQGISMEGDDILLAEMNVKVEPKRDEWMTTLPPERKPGMTTQSTKFSRSSKEGRGDTSTWTDTPSDRAQKAKMNYLEAYNEAAALASNVQEKAKMDTDAKLVDEYNKAKRSKSLVEKHQESARSLLKKKKKGKGEEGGVKEEWEGQHPWKPWDREKDLTAGRLNVKLDAENMTQGLTSRFSSGSFQRNFL